MYLKKAKFMVYTLPLMVILILFLPTATGITVKLVSNTDYCLNCETVYELCNEGIPETSLNLNYYQPTGSKESISDFTTGSYETITYQVQKPIYDTRTIITTAHNNATGKLQNVSNTETYIKSYDSVPVQKQELMSYDTKALSQKLTDLKIGDCMKLSVKGSLKPGQAVDNILTVGTKAYQQYAWWNSTYIYRKLINCSNMAVNSPLVINGSNGFVLPGDNTRQIVWALCNESPIYVYYNSYNQYSIGTNITGVPYDVEIGNITSSNPQQVWKNYLAVYHMNLNPDTTITDNSPQNNTLLQGYVAAHAAHTINSIGGYCVGNCQYLSGASRIFLESTNNIPFSANQPFTIQGYVQYIAVGSYAMFLSLESPVAATFRFFYTHVSYTYMSNAVANTYDDLTNVSKLAMNYSLYEIYNGTDLDTYVGRPQFPSQEHVRNLKKTTDQPMTALHLCVGATCNNGDWNPNAVIDEVRIYNGTLSYSQISGEYDNFLSKSGFGMLGSDESEPFIKFDFIQPVNLTSSNFISKIVNISYNYSNIDTSTFSLFHKTNNTITDIFIYINGSSSIGFKNRVCINTSSSKALCTLDDNDIIPGTYLIDFDQHEDILHVPVYNLTGSNDYVKLGLYNLTNITYGIFEFMVNSSSSDIYPIIFCNSSYTTGSPTSSPNCVQFASFIGNLTYNHSHSYSSHRIRPFGINASTGRINGIKVTPLSYFLFNKGTGATLQVWGINNKSNINLVQFSANGGNTWIGSGNIAPDYHVHQISNPTTFYYYLCGNSTLDNSSICSSQNFDLLELTLLAPTSPFLFPIPQIIKQNTTITINWSESNDPNDLGIAYNLSQYNISGFMTSYEGNNTYLTHNFTESVGNYSFNVRAKNSEGLVSGFTTSNQVRVCANDWNCTQYHVCAINNITVCEAVTDLGCGETYAGNLTDFDLACVYLYAPTPTSMTTIDLTQQSNVILFGLFMFFWIGLAILTMTFKNFVYGSMMFFIGVLLGFWSFSISWLLSAMFLMFSAVLMMKTASFK